MNLLNRLKGACQSGWARKDLDREMRSYESRANIALQALNLDAVGFYTQRAESLRPILPEGIFERIAFDCGRKVGACIY